MYQRTGEYSCEKAFGAAASNAAQAHSAKRASMDPPFGLRPGAATPYVKRDGAAKPLKIQE